MDGWGHHKPDSVSRPKTACDHLSPTDRSQRTRRSEVRLIPEAISRPEPGSGAAHSFLLLCLAPHGVCLASRLTPWSGELLPRHFNLTTPKRGGVFSVTLSVTVDFRRRCPHFHVAW